MWKRDRYGQIFIRIHCVDDTGRHSIGEFSTIRGAVRETGKVVIAEHSLDDLIMASLVVLMYFKENTNYRELATNLKMYPFKRCKEIALTTSYLHRIDPTKWKGQKPS